MPNMYLQNLITRQHETIFGELTRRLTALPRSRYQTFMKSKEGSQRIRQWIDNLIEALGGNEKVFFSDTKEIGYLRADQGYRVDFIFRYYITFQNIVWELLTEEAEKNPDIAVKILKEYYHLMHIMVRALQLVTSSYLKKREDIISEKVTHLELVSDFTRKIISKFSIENIAEYIQKEILQLFNAKESILLLFHADHTQRIYTRLNDDSSMDKILPILKATRKAGVSLFMASSGKITRNIGYSASKRVVSMPIRVNQQNHGVLLVCDWENGFHFTAKEHDFLLQFINIIVVAVDNALMLEEIAKGRQDMRLLVGNIINIEEERKKRLAGDIHDTLTQTLTAIGYKIQLFKELYRKKAESMEDQLDELVESVHTAISQSRHITSSLHPDLIVNLGLVPALERHITNFEKETGIRVKTAFEQGIKLPYDVEICLFRVVQEALTNVSKHADTDKAEVSLQHRSANIHLIVKDGGKGVKWADMIPDLRNGRKMGLMILKERIESVNGKLFIDKGKGKGFQLEVVVNIPTESTSYE